MENIIVAITGASGIAYSKRLLQILGDRPYSIHLSVSEAAAMLIESELGIKLDLNDFDPGKLVDGTKPHNINYYHISDVSAPISNGKFKAKAMVIVPCSMNTLCSIANGIASNLIQRAASVALKESRRLIVVPRETPLTSIHLECMLKLSNAGTCILPAMPGFYNRPKTIDDNINFIVDKIIDSMDIEK